MSSHSHRLLSHTMLPWEDLYSHVLTGSSLSLLSHTLCLTCRASVRGTAPRSAATLCSGWLPSARCLNMRAVWYCTSSEG